MHFNCIQAKLTAESYRLFAHQTTCNPLFVRVDSSKETLENERSKRTTCTQCPRRFKECCFLPLFSLQGIDYKKFLKFLYDVATIGQKNSKANLSAIHDPFFYGFPVSKRIRKWATEKNGKLLRYFHKLLREMCNLTFHHGVTALRRSTDEVFDKQKFILKNTQIKETKALLAIFSCLLF